MAGIRVLIVDDEPLAREKIRTLLAAEPDIGALEECTGGAEAILALRERRPDLVFLDVQMPEVNGFEVLDAVGAEHIPVIIFVTAYDQYALRAFDVHAVDYLLKPFDHERLHRALDRARAWLGRLAGGDRDPRMVALLDELGRGRRYLDRLVIKEAGRVFFLRTGEVDWIESAGNYVRLYVGKEDHMLRETMNALEARLDPRSFVRIHRTRIVNVDRIKEVQPWFHGEYVVVLQTGAQLTTGRGYRQRLHGLMQMCT